MGLQELDIKVLLGKEIIVRYGTINRKAVVKVVVEKDNEVQINYDGLEDGEWDVMTINHFKEILVSVAS